MSSKPPKDIKAIQLYFDLNDDKQKKCYDLIRTLSRKKSRFITSVVNQFLKNYPNATDKKTLDFYVEHFEEISNLSPAMQPAIVIQDGGNHAAAVNPAVPESSAKPDIDAEKEQDIIDAMSAFTV